MCRLLFLLSTFMSFTLRCFGRLLLLLFLAASISVLYAAMLRLWLTALLLGREACWKNTYLLKVAIKYVFIFIFGRGVVAAAAAAAACCC